MTITIELPSEVEKTFKAFAKERNMSVEGLIETLILEHTSDERISYPIEESQTYKACQKRITPQKRAALLEQIEREAKEDWD